tara:strand:+ start:780 stop:947 length:168 start_codon:yes stop_codon:yes gene_type:complete
MLFVDKNRKLHNINRGDFKSDKEYFSKIYLIKTGRKIINTSDRKNIISTILYEDK